MWGRVKRNGSNPLRSCGVFRLLLLHIEANLAHSEIPQVRNGHFSTLPTQSSTGIAQFYVETSPGLWNYMGQRFRAPTAVALIKLHRSK